ncbi:GH23822 [Drosophila grimshawi]|uniref:GH23822 n=1 Tax=Drosophila grimshawi TaxID=7222 RepID=B4JTE8_DROGR|nr:GH23822 [Drosophila grimshawi]
MADTAPFASSDEELTPISNQPSAHRDYSDVRLERVAAYTTTTMRLKPDKWSKMMAHDEFRRIVMDWVSGRTRVLVMTLSPGGELVPRSCVSDLYCNYTLQSSSSGSRAATVDSTVATAAVVAAATTTGAMLVPMPPPSSSFTTLDGVPRGKCAYFIRHSDVDVPLSADNFQSSVLYGDFPVHSKIETMSLLFDEVLQPLLEQAQGQWPTPVRKDLEGRVKDVRNTLTEEMFINWTTQMHDIVMERSESIGLTTGSAASSKHLNVVTLPAQEILFWTNRKLNLQNIYEQLSESVHKALAHILERIQSVYYEPYAKAFRQLLTAWLEAKDVSLWLQPLQRQTAAFNSVQFSNAQELIAPLVHVLHLLWSNARFYRSTQRMSVLLRCICNMLVHRAAEDLEFPMLFQGDADEGLQRIKKTGEVLEFFNQVLLPALLAVATTSAAAAAAATTPSPTPADQQQLWRFSSEQVFGQTLDGFLLQLTELRHVFEAAVQFQQLEKLEIGGLRGKLLTERIREIFNEFKRLFEQWTNVDIDLAAPVAHKWKSFKREQCIFFGRMQLLEQKLATVLVQAFEQCHSWRNLLKLTLMFGCLLQRSEVQAELVRLLPHMLNMYNAELQQLEQSVADVLLLYQCHGLEAMPLADNFPPIAGAIMWLEQHLHRCDDLGAKDLTDLIQTLLTLKSQFVTLPFDWDALVSRRNILTTKMCSLQLKIWQCWLQDIDRMIAEGLTEPVLIQLTAGQQLQPNFAKALFTLLKETKYLLALQASGSFSSKLFPMPEALLALYEERDAYWQRRIRLIKIDEYYNGIRAGQCAEAELQLIEAELATIDGQVGIACEQLSWRNYDEPLIESIFEKSRDLFARLQQSHGNLDAIMASMRRWSREPLHQRSLYGRNLLDLRHQQERVRLRLLQCDETKMLLNRLLIANFCLLFNYESQQFQLYSRDLNVQEATATIIPTPTTTATSGTATTTTNDAPLFEVKLELTETEIRFSPAFDVSAENNFQQIVEQLLLDIKQTCDCMPRIVSDKALSDEEVDGDDDDDANNVGNENEFKNGMEPARRIVKAIAAVADDVEMLCSSIRDALTQTVQAALNYAAKFHAYAFLWTQLSDAVFASCMQMAGEQTTHISGSGYAIMETFKKEIERYNELHDEIDLYENRHCINGWLDLDVKPLKHGLLNLACKWSHLYKQWLLRYVQQTLQELNAFIARSHETLQLHIARQDFRALLRVLSVMAEIRQREPYADNVFKPLKDIVALLRTYNVEFEAQLMRNIEQLPVLWKQLKQQALAKQEALHDTRYYQQQRVTALIGLHTCHVQHYAKQFQRMPFFHVSCPQIYDACDQVYVHLHHFDSQQRRYASWARLLDIDEPDTTTLQHCRTELRRVKQLWDFVRVIESCIVDWHATPWLRIDTDDMEHECKKFTRDLRTLDKCIREWAPYVYIVGVLRDLVASLRAVTELQNPAITERHWLELMQLSKLSYKCNTSTTLEQLLSLQLQQHEEDIKNTVDRAIKEMTVTKVLDDIKATWAHLEFELEPHQTRPTVRLLKVSEELIETLDDNQMQLQNISTSKHIEYLLDKLGHWQRVLSGIDTLIVNWFEVQRKWIYLECIFIGSEDIRSQLPQDAANFERIDEDFTNLLARVNHVRVVMQVVLQHKDVLQQLLELQQRLSICEKALNDYLETKRLVFPRFYFISAADLLDILSNGNNPQVIDRHLIKLFDSILRLQYETNTTHALGMHSKENDEYVTFVGSQDQDQAAFIDCSGRVELWLRGVIQQMRSTLHELFRRALVAFGEKSRDIWLYDWPAQVALCCSQIHWTVDVNRSFASMEEGYEGAMKELHKRQIAQLNALINLLLGELSPGDRQKIMTICTIDVHSRDVIGKIIATKVDNSLAFQWQSQLRHRWDDDQSGSSSGGATATTISNGGAGGEEDCFANICDAEFRYAYEYLGNTSRLVITPLTDRCYITLTQSLHLVMGGAPAGPAGTGKTETTKDLGRALGVMVYVFNCSEQMDYKSCGNIYKGLAQTGAWGCFDEFNRICVEVLSVVAVQVKTIQEAIKMHKTQFIFMGERISLEPAVGIFITMNPGYAGRTELPENLKTLFRPCAMIVPDFALICEIMLMAEGFQDARLLARKFITLYTLCKELLSKQDHYDWGLRAIKSVLVVAGTLKRDDHSRPEDQVLMRALRDFNIPKIVTEDVPIFMGLIGDLFPALDVPRKRVFEFEKTIRRAVNEIKLQPEEGFLMKVVQLQELLDVRHSVFIVGDAGTGKTKIWQTLRETYRIQKMKPVCHVLNPKALSNDELFGIVNPTTREWKDGLFSSIMREQANMPPGNPKWIVLDGDIDPMWIESLNTLMDDNKILTLASNERISLKREMRLLFEVGHLKAATPATVSRAGILYINPQDLGWSPFVSSWLETRVNMIERGILTTLFEKYFPSLMQKQHDFRRITPITDMAMIQMTCHLLECLLDSDQADDDTGRGGGKHLGINSHTLHHGELSHESAELALETIFVYVTMWSFGSALHQDTIIDWHREFHKWWTGEYKDVKLPSQGNLFDYQLNVQTLKFQRWSELAAQEQQQDYQIEVEQPLQNVLISTAETTRLGYFLKLLIDRNLACMLVGTSGCGKGAIFRELFSKYASAQELLEIAFNFYTTSEIFQKMLDRPLEKKSGRCYAPSGPKRRLIYFVNDLNMPEVDAYGTVQPHTIMRQFMDYRQWYDRQRLQLKDIRHCQFAACMNPTAGSFTIDPRLQRHFCVFSVAPPGEETLHYIYSSILNNHLEQPLQGFSKEIRSIGNLLVKVGIALHRRVEYAFLPTAIKFHYIFNLRDLTNIYQGVVNCVGAPVSAGGADSSYSGTMCSKPAELMRLYVHEAYRVYHDRLVDQYDIKSFKSSIRDIFKKDFEDFDEDFVFAEPLVYCHFAQSLVDQKYMPVKSWDSLYQLLLEAQGSYNDIVGYMNLVLFEDAMIHVCRINRILESPRGNALLIGVGGSGKQTLARLAAFISSLSVSQIQIKRGFGLLDMRDEIASLYMKVGLKNVSSVFLISDAQLPDESILMLINDLLASGEIPELFNDDQLDTIINGIRNEVKQSGALDTKENCWRYFVEKVRRLLKVVLCLSPVGQTLRVRARKFPAIFSRTAINWFHEWPRSALESVSQKFLTEISDILEAELIPPIGCFMAYVHGTVNQISKIYLQNEKRYNYTTPKTFLEYIFLYRKLLVDKNGEFAERIARLQSGMAKLAECARQVDTLKHQLAIQEVQLAAKNAAADKLIGIVSAESEKVKRERFTASEEEKRVRIIEEDVSIKTKLCEQDLRQAEPALVAAQAALNTLNKNNLTELKSFGSPPKAVINVCAAVMVLLATNGKIPRDRSWKTAKLMMVRVDQFLNDLLNYNKDNIHPNIIETLQEYLKDPEFNPDKVVQKSVAAAGLCAWVINLHRYHQVFLIVGPKQQAVQDAQQELFEARERLQYLKSKINNLEDKLADIQAEFEHAVAEKQKCQKEADKTSFTIDLAHRLVNGLANENIRWRESVQSLQAKIGTLPGDILLISSFLSYVGCFTRRYREELQHKMWLPSFCKVDPPIPHTEGVDPLNLLSDDAQIATWNNEGLPMDGMSTENATILQHSTRWPLMIDPQLMPPLEGAFVHELYLDGASWDCQLNSIVSLHPKELLCAMPVIYIKSICILHKLFCRSRGNTYVWTLNLKTRDRPAKWILAGVALLLQP